ncbi:hypothetical protein [Cellulosimicrobium marinum]|uniref:hypothetical protein n=1 Tax=Cellulosimicrobium marinum TaxID=1638992 RepID=UPI001E38D8B4|nr:hypothetical protein [Cellulosimicrobium marinum]MCB7135084.1 hypothetical protein [Cellulosimicrobium marinum]
MTSLPTRPPGPRPPVDPCTSARRRAGVAAAALSLSVLLVACTGDDPEPGPSPVVVGAQEYEPVLEVRLPVPGSAEDEVTVGLVSLVAEGPTVELRVLLTPHFVEDDPDRPEEHSVYDMLGSHHDPWLLDVDTLTRYDVVSAPGEDLSTDIVYAQTTNDRALLYQAWFPRPEGDPAAVDVRLHDAWPAFEDVPVTWEEGE